MKMSRRARRMERHHKKNKQPALNLVSLMDIFTILVFFLLVNSSSSQQLPKKNELTLPTSVSQSVPEDRLTITLTKTQVLVGSRSLGGVSEFLANEEALISELNQELAFYSSSEVLNEDGEGAEKAITILADEDTPYELVSKILSTCQQANYTNISFAATQKAKSKI